MSTSNTATADKQNSMNKSFNLRDLLVKYGMVGILALIFIFFSMLIPSFATAGNILSTLEQVSMFGVISIGVTFIIITGGIDLSSGSVVALTSVVCAMIVGASADLHIIVLAILASMGVGAICGLINGSFTALVGIPPFVATLGMMTIARGAASLISAGRPVNTSSAPFEWIAGSSFYGIPGLVIIYVAIVIIASLILKRTQYGRHVYAIGGNEHAAKICGINVKKTLMITYIFAGALSGIAGMMLTSRSYAGNPVYGNMWELDAIAATVIGGTSLSGGRGSVFMCMIGALIIGFINKGLNLIGVDAYWQYIVKGSIIIAAVCLDTIQNKKSK